jgi:hypothetical protein
MDEFIFTSPDIFWDGILSREKQRILFMFSSIDKMSQRSVVEHLLRMVEEEGWQPEQRQSARIALCIICDPDSHPV